VKVLIVDDSAMMRKVVERALRQAGLNLTEVIQANNGAEALVVLREAPRGDRAFDLIMSDINMPVMDGLEFIEQRKKEGLAPGVPAVMITTEGSSPNVMRALAAGAKGYICKPFTTDQIKACVMPLLNAAA
jgi:two-component system, chemotaxis family, chemotaxis protein CheY